MQIILLERVVNLGFIGEIVSVKNGFARNFLIPQRKALRATKENIELFKEKKAHIEADNLKKKSEAEIVASKMAGLNVNVMRQAGEFGRLFGSVRSIDIVHAINETGFLVDKSQISLDIPIKTLGIYSVKLILHPDVCVNIGVNVAQSEEEAKSQLKEHEAANNQVNEKVDKVERETKKRKKEEKKEHSEIN
jgi:large subunit ribosomal protein L9